MWAFAATDGRRREIPLRESRRLQQIGGYSKSWGGEKGRKKLGRGGGTKSHPRGDGDTFTGAGAQHPLKQLHGEDKRRREEGRKVSARVINRQVFMRGGGVSSLGFEVDRRGKAGGGGHYLAASAWACRTRRRLPYRAKKYMKTC